MGLTEAEGPQPATPRAFTKFTNTSEATLKRSRDPQLVIAAFAAKFPQCFYIDETQRRPLKLGIHRDLFAAGFNDDEIRAALGRYVHSTEYLWKLAAGGARVGLDGRPDGEVTEAQQFDARNKITWRTDAAFVRKKQEPNDNPIGEEPATKLYSANADKPRLTLKGRA